MPTLWTIKTREGDILGEQTAISPKVALILHLAQDSSPRLSDVEVESSGDGEYRLTFRGETFLLSRGDRAS
jgi:hypothetical protein